MTAHPEPTEGSGARVGGPQDVATGGRAWKRIAKLFGCGLLSLMIVLMAAWGVLAIYYSNLPGEPLRMALAGVFGLGTPASFIFIRNRRRVLAGFFLAFALLVVWFLMIPPSNNRDWQPDVAVPATATINGDEVTIHNIRDCEYRTETDYTPRYHDRTYDLRKLNSVDLICVYWGSEAIAHVMVSFGFAGKDYVCISIETRKQRGQGYSTIKGFFRQFELYYVVADERDLIGLRTNYRRPEEQVYLFRTRIPRGNQRKLFLDYLRTINQLAQHPAWYNTLTENCTTGVLLHTRAYPHRGRYNWKLLLSGYAAQYAYEIGGLDSSVSFEELRQRGHVNDRAHAAARADDFSRRIRAGIPTPEPIEN